MMFQLLFLSMFSIMNLTIHEKRGDFLSSSSIMRSTAWFSTAVSLSSTLRFAERSSSRARFLSTLWKNVSMVSTWK